MVLKVKEPIAQEYGFLRDDLLLFTFLHLAADRPLTEALLAAGTTASPTRRCSSTTAGCRCSRR
jgi:alanine dehydrogenase